MKLILILLNHLRYRLRVRSRPGLPIFPWARRINMQLIAQELVKIEPMKLPSGLLFYLDFPKEQEDKPKA